MVHFPGVTLFTLGKVFDACHPDQDVEPTVALVLKQIEEHKFIQRKLFFLDTKAINIFNMTIISASKSSGRKTQFPK